MNYLDYCINFLSAVKTNQKSPLRLNEKLVILESDDWGAIRTPSAKVLLEFEKYGFNLDKSIYKYDALASETDLNSLFDLLLSIKNAEGEHPVLTANSIMANPDFEKIRDSGFNEYHFEPFYKTFERYSEHKNNLEIWKKGIEMKIFKPQFHGREHLNINRWMKSLQNNDKDVHFSFKKGSTYSGKADYSFMEAYDWNDCSEVKAHKKIIKEGLNIFEKVFGYKSTSFIAPCYNWDAKLEPFLAKQGITCIQGVHTQLSPTGKLNSHKHIKHFFGKKNNYGSFYNVRNVFFEPIDNPKKDWSDGAMARIHAAFLFDKPAVISTHRINYIGYVCPQNRDNGLLQLKRLLTKVVTKWPDVKFISTDQLSNYLK
tara:strand:- start:3960 stop:5072 length:1113 start_codon:yes stop_codon:yes gene_type:complete